MKNLKLLIYLIVPLVFPLWARADKYTEANIQKLNPSFGEAYGIINDLMNRIPTYLGGMALLAILYSGAIYIGSFGDPTKMEQAKKNLTWTVTGIVAVAAIYGIITTILWITNPAVL